MPLRLDAGVGQELRPDVRRSPGETTAGRRARRLSVTLLSLADPDTGVDRAVKHSAGRAHLLQNTEERVTQGNTSRPRTRQYWETRGLLQLSPPLKKASTWHAVYHFKRIVLKCYNQ